MIDILMPRLSDTMTEGSIVSWLKRPGDAISPGDVLLEIETDKALMEQEAYEAGTLAEILVPEGERAAIGTPIARLDDRIDHAPGETASANAPASVGQEAAVQDSAPPASTLHEPPSASIARAQNADRRAATPLVRRLARERGLDLADIEGTGPGGRIVRADIEAADRPNAPAAPAERTDGAHSTQDLPETTAVPFDGTRRIIASRLTESATTIPVFHAIAAADVSELLALRARLNESAPTPEDKISVNDLMIKAVALALREHPAINASYSSNGGGQTLLHQRIGIGVAVAAPTGLVVPVVRAPEKSSVTELARRTRELARRAAARSLTAAEMDGGTFTVSNLGMFGVEQFTAIINPPQGAILAVGGITEELALVDDRVTVRHRLRGTLSCDHRIIDGADAGRFLATLTGLLENPLRLLA